MMRSQVLSVPKRVPGEALVLPGQGDSVEILMFFNNGVTLANQKVDVPAFPPIWNEQIILDPNYGLSSRRARSLRALNGESDAASVRARTLLQAVTTLPLSATCYQIQLNRTSVTGSNQTELTLNMNSLAQNATCFNLQVRASERQDTLMFKVACCARRL
jgi:hypothetical protein